MKGKASGNQKIEGDRGGTVEKKIIFLLKQGRQNLFIIKIKTHK